MQQQTIVKTYKGSQADATNQYKWDAIEMEKKGYLPTSQVWTPGSYGCGSFVLAALLCFILIGILIFVYMLIVKPAGTLTVTYALAPRVDPEKTCPKCAERVKLAATICRFCGHTFDTLAQPMAAAPAAVAPVRRSGAEDFGRSVGKLFAKRPRKD